MTAATHTSVALPAVLMQAQAQAVANELASVLGACVSEGGEAVLDASALVQFDFSIENIISEEDFIAEFLHKPFDIANGPLLKMGLLKYEETKWKILLLQHHLITDGWSMERFFAEFSCTYSALLSNELPASSV